ncbi:cutinase [Actinomycetospora succinea]|uniref:Cutinase n=1 Tax=Actinomycetospora succinea TaxID=663603 RepID=A0A4R6VAC8_9PSEU|nr:heparin lyase I family protein [Actinomycetospora succinea]TDQ58615.1 cutinase [Actinomycetospora succinea]
MSATERVVDRFGRSVPASPVVRLRVDRTPGRVPLHVDGAAVAIGRGVDPHREGLAYAASRAARLGRPVRVEMASPWSTWPLVVHPDGEVDDGRAPRASSGWEKPARRRSRRAPVLAGVAERPRRRPIGLLAFTAAVAATLMVGAVGTGVVTVAAPDDTAPAECRDVTLFSVNGSGAGGGETLGALTDPLVQRVGQRLAVVAVPGPEVGAGEQQAVTALTEQVGTQLAGCPGSRVMLFGYSQGAQVAGDAAARIGAGQEAGVPADRVLAVGLFGDPARDPDVRTVPDGVTGRGVLPVRQGGFGSLASRTIQVCAPDDPVCATAPGATPPALEEAVASPAHAGYDQLEVAPNTPATRWASESLGRLITSLPAASTGPAANPAGAPATSSAAPETAAPGGSGYETAAPDGGTTTGGAAPGTTAPGTAAPEASVPGGSEYETTAPDGGTAGGAAPATTTPGTAAPEASVPGGSEYETTAPDASGYETAAPGGAAPRTTAPERSAPGGSELPGSTQLPGSGTGTGQNPPGGEYPDEPGASTGTGSTGSEDEPGAATPPGSSGTGAPATTTAPGSGGSTGTGGTGSGYGTRATTPPNGDADTESGSQPRSTTPPSGGSGTGSQPRSTTPPETGSGTGSGSQPRSTTPPDTGAGSQPRSTTPPDASSGTGSGSRPRSTTPPTGDSDTGTTCTPGDTGSAGGSGSRTTTTAPSTGGSTYGIENPSSPACADDTSTTVPRTSADEDTGTSTGTTSTGRDTGALWALTSGLTGFQDSTGGNVEGGGRNPEEVESPNVPGRQVVKLEVPGGAKRSEVRPEEAQNIREGQRLYFGYSAFLPEDFPVDTRDWQVIWQLHDGGSNTSPPVALEVVEGRLWLANVGDRVRDLGPVRAGQNLAVQMDIAFEIGGGSVSVYRDGQQVLQDFRPPRGTMIDSFDYLKTGIYRHTDGPAEPATLFLNDLKIGDSLESVSDLAGAGQVSATAENTGAPRGLTGGGTDASNTGGGIGTSTRVRQR